jgi:hypothetical protein
VANAGALSEALRAAEDELHGLLGGERDRERERQALAAEAGPAASDLEAQSLALAVAAPGVHIRRHRDTGLQPMVWNGATRL